MRTFNLLRRTLIAFLPALARPDDAFATAWLEPGELTLYLGMDPRDRQHACQVAGAVLSTYPDAPPALVRAALFHDLGKSARPYRAFERILMHFPWPVPPAEPRLGGVRGLWQMRAHHPAYGAARLREAGVCPAVAEIVARHHQPGAHELAERLKRVEARF